jgi:hypothetical protein
VLLKEIVPWVNDEDEKKDAAVMTMVMEEEDMDKRPKTYAIITR